MVVSEEARGAPGLGEMLSWCGSVSVGNWTRGGLCMRKEWSMSYVSLEEGS